MQNFINILKTIFKHHFIFENIFPSKNQCLRGSIYMLKCRVENLRQRTDYFMMKLETPHRNNLMTILNGFQTSLIPRNIFAFDVTWVLIHLEELQSLVFKEIVPRKMAINKSHFAFFRRLIHSKILYPLVFSLFCLACSMIAK